jgi:hypothetical protein
MVDHLYFTNYYHLNEKWVNGPIKVKKVSTCAAHRLADPRLRRKRKVPQRIGSALCTTKNVVSNLRKRLCCTFAKC